MKAPKECERSLEHVFDHLSQINGEDPGQDIHNRDMAVLLLQEMFNYEPNVYTKLGKFGV